MTTLQRIFISQGFWITGYEPYDMPGAFCQARYKITEGSIADGEYNGLVPFENTLRIASGGEYYGGAVINHSMTDLSVEFDDAFHDEYLAGLSRGYKGKRAAGYDYFCRQSEAWRDGYRAGRSQREMMAAA